MNFVLKENPLEFNVFEIILKEPFGERDPKGERYPIPYLFMKFDGENLPLVTLEPSRP